MMVFESVAVRLLDKYLGDYIQNLDAKKLKIDLWNGNVALENVYLKPDALTKLKFPAKIVTGYVEKLFLHVRWDRLYTHPIQIIIDGFYLFIEPDIEIKHDAEQEEQEEYDAKMKEVHKVEEFRKEKEEYEKSKRCPKHKDTFVERLELHLIRNVEVSISNIHIAIEDKVTKSCNPFTFGITLNYIKFSTTNSHWEYVKVIEDSPDVYKLAELNHFSIYWNSNIKPRSNLSKENIINDLREKIGKNDQNLTYILRPSNIKAKLKTAAAYAHENYNRPLFDIKIDFHEINFNINCNQYSDLLDFLELRDYINLQSKYSKYKQTIKTNKKLSLQRWEFAYTVILNEQVRPRLAYYKWENIKTNLERCREYRNIHVKQLTHQANASDEQRAIELEKQIDIFNLIYNRRIAQLDVRKKKAEKKEKSWWDKLSNWWNDSTNKDNSDFDHVIIDDEKKKFYDAIGYKDNQQLSIYPEEYIDLHLSFRINSFEFNVWSNIDKNNSKLTMISQTIVSNISFTFERRPSTSAILIILDIGSLIMYGCVMESNKDEISINNHSPLIQLINRSDLNQEKFFHLEFETNPLETNADYRIEVQSQSLETIYNSVTINQLIQCFHPGGHRKLKTVKITAYSIYSDIKHQTQFLLNYHLRHIKALDIYIDIQSFYFILPQNGIYTNDCSSIHMDFGHFIVVSGVHQQEEIFEDANSDNINDINDSSYIPIQVRLEDVRLICAKSNEHWKNVLNERDSPMYLIKPMTFALDIFKSICLDDTHLPIWKIDAQLSSMDCRLSNTRLFEVLKLIQSIPTPQSDQSSINTEITIDELYTSQDTKPQENTKKTFEKVENMVMVKKKLKQAQNAEQGIKEEKEEEFDEQPIEQNGWEKDNPQSQLIELAATLNITQINLIIEESLSNESDDSQPFVKISLVSIVAQTNIKTFDIELNAYINDLIIIHQQFRTNNNESLRLFSNINDQKLITTKCLFTSSENPLFYSNPYNNIENKIEIHINKPVFILQIEALISIARFQNDIINKLPKQQQSQNNSNPNENMNNNSTSSISSSQIEIDLEQFQIIIGTEVSQMLDIQFKGLIINASQSAKNTSLYFIINDIHILDLQMNARYTQIFIQQNHEDQILSVQLSKYNYSKLYEKMLDEVDYDINIHLAKMNLVLLYKYIDLILNLLNLFKTKNGNVSSTKTNNDSNMMEQFEENMLKIRFDIILHLPTILIPINSQSNEGIFIDLGQLTLKTHLFNDPTRSFIEQQIFIFKDFLVNRVNLNNNNEIIGDIILIKCAQFDTFIDRLLDSNKIKNGSQISVNIDWETIDLTISKDDYYSIMKISKENFSEKVYHYKIHQQQSQDQPTNQVDINPRKKQKNLSNEKIFEKILLDFLIKKISLTLFIDESNLNVHQQIRNENSKFINMNIEMIEGHFQYLSDSSYNAQGQIQCLLLEDLRQTNPSNSVTRLFDRNFNVDQKEQLLIATLKFKPNSQTNEAALQQVNVQLESFYLCLTPECLMALKDFIDTDQSSDNETESQQLITSPPLVSDVRNDIPPPAKSISTDHDFNRESSSISTTSQRTNSFQSSSVQVSSNENNSIETRFDLMIKTPQIIWLENQHDANSNCLVISLFLQTRMIIISEETHLYGSIKDLSIYTSNFNELKDSKIKYHILQPIIIDTVFVVNSEYEKYNLSIGNADINITPADIRTISNMIDSITKAETNSPEKKQEINSKSLFDPKPFKDSSFWFIEDAEMIEDKDILEITTGTPSHNKYIKKDKNKQTKKQTKKFYSQHIIFDSKFIEVKLQLGSGLTTKSVTAICLSNLSADIKNWSTDINICSRIHVELALFNDHILAWEPLIEPIVDERGQLISPWSITCTTILKDDKNENGWEGERRSIDESRMLRSLRSHHRDSLSDSEEQSKDISNILNSKNKIHIRGEHLLNITLTKSNIDLITRISKQFMDAYNRDLIPAKDDNEDELMLSVHNMTGYQIIIDQLNGVQYVDNNNSSNRVTLEDNESVSMTVPGERLSATHLPEITKQMIKRQQQFYVKIDKNLIKVDINRTWKRVYDLCPSFSPNWPIQMLCDSQIFNNRRRVILSSIVKIYNKSDMDLFILNVDSIEMNKYEIIYKLKANEEHYLPIKLLYIRSSPRLFIGIDEDDSTQKMNDFISFDWVNEITMDRILKTKNDKKIHFVIYKKTLEAYCENTDEPIRSCFEIYIKLVVHIINLLPIDIQCYIDNSDQINLKPSELYQSISGNKKSILLFTIPSYNNKKWTSRQVDLSVKGHGSHHEQIVQFNDVDGQETLRMILRIDTYRESYRVSLYSPFWVVNCTDLKFQFKIENDKTLIEVSDKPFFICPKTFENKSHKLKGNIRLYNIEEDESVFQWSDPFSLHVIKHTGITICKVLNDRDYMVCVDIETCSFGMSRIITLSPLMSIINKSTIEIEIIDKIFGIEQDDWKMIKPGQIITFWPRNIREGVMCVRYVHNRSSSSTFIMNDKHRTLLRMNDEDRPALHVEVTMNNSDGISIIFGDYKIGDAPLLLVNFLINESIRYYQEQDKEIQTLPCQHYVYYTWIDPLKPHKLSIVGHEKDTIIQLNTIYGILKLNNNKMDVFYGTFYDGPQTVLVFTENKSIIDLVLEISSEQCTSDQLLNQYIELSLSEIGISIINDITHDDLFYITINKSNEIWTETQDTVVKPLSRQLNHDLEKSYKKYLNNKKVQENEYRIMKHHIVSFNENIGQIINRQGNIIRVERQSLDGLWIGYGWSSSINTLHIRINHLQIDNQLEYTMFPVIFHPIISKVAGTDTPGQPFIEMSVLKRTVARSNTVYFKYLKLLIQEFAFYADQGLIVSIFSFIKSEKPKGLRIDMESDLKYIDKPYESYLKGQVENQSTETMFYFDCIHLSPLKIHVSFSVHGTKPSEQILIEYPLSEFLLQLLNIAEVEDVVLKLHCYDREKDRFTITKLQREIMNHYEYEFLKQIHVVILGLDVLGNPYGIIRGVAEGVKSFFYEPIKGATEGPREFFEGMASGAGLLVGSAVGSVADGASKITDTISKGFATLTFDKDYECARVQRKEWRSATTSDVIQSGKYVVKDVVHGAKHIIKKPVSGAKEEGAIGFFKGLGKGCIGFIARPSSSIADFTSTSFSSIKRSATHEKVVRRVRNSRSVGRDGIIRPSMAYEKNGLFIFNRLDIEKYTKSDEYIAHISCSENRREWLMVTWKHLLFVSEQVSVPDVFGVEWHLQYKELKGFPIVKFDPVEIEFVFKEPKVFERIKKERVQNKSIACQNVGEARYIVDKISKIMHAMEL